MSIRHLTKYNILPYYFYPLQEKREIIMLFKSQEKLKIMLLLTCHCMFHSTVTLLRML